jgi:hypothetical protein
LWWAKQWRTEELTTPLRHRRKSSNAGPRRSLLLDRWAALICGCTRRSMWRPCPAGHIVQGFGKNNVHQHRVHR